MKTPADLLQRALKAMGVITHDQIQTIDSFTPEQMKIVSAVALAASADSWEAGVRSWAWWKDGEQHVGTCGTTLADALTRNPYR